MYSSLKRGLLLCRKTEVERVKPISPVVFCSVSSGPYDRTILVGTECLEILASRLIGEVKSLTGTARKPRSVEQTE